MKSRRSGEIANRIFETYKNSIMPQGKHMLKTASDMDMTTMCAYPPSRNALPHLKCVLHCCEKFPRIDIPSTE